MSAIADHSHCDVLAIISDDDVSLYLIEACLVDRNEYQFVVS